MGEAGKNALQHHSAGTLNTEVLLPSKISTSPAYLCQKLGTNRHHDFGSDAGERFVPKGRNGHQRCSSGFSACCTSHVCSL